MKVYEQGEESYKHKYAKELLYEKIANERSFSFLFDRELDKDPIYWKETLPNVEYHEQCVLMEVPCYRGYISQCEHCNQPIGNIKNDYRNGYCEIKYGDGRGYFKCESCDSKDWQYLKYTKNRHDIAAFIDNKIIWAIEIVANHLPDWDDGKTYLNYPVYLVMSDWVLDQPLLKNNFLYGNISIFDFIIQGSHTEDRLLEYVKEQSKKPCLK